MAVRFPGAPMGTTRGMSDFMSKAEKFAGSHEKQVDEGLDHAGQEVDQRTDHRYDKEVDKGVRAAEKEVHDRGGQ